MKPREPRRKVLIKARMRLDGSWRDVCIRNISSRGLLLHTPYAPPRGTYVEVCRGRHLIVARVAWSGGAQCGVFTQDKLNVDAIVQEPDLSAPEHRKQAIGETMADRRLRPRRPTSAESAERSRFLSRAVEFGFVVAFCVSAGTVVFGLVERTIRAPADIISARLEEAR